MYQLENIEVSTVVKRPSQHCKTPYVADIMINGTETMGHTAALGCSGLCDKDAIVYVTKNKNQKNICSHRIDLAKYKEGNRCIIVGINPKLAETIINTCLEQSKTSFLPNVQSFEREKEYLNSRFDFCGTDAQGKHFVMEVKNVPLADYVDVPKKDKKKALDQVKNKVFQNKIAYFPDGYRKQTKDVVSPRALKHVHDLTEITRTTNSRAILCFVTQRLDVCCFQPSNIDPEYKQAVQNAWLYGVEIKCVQVYWTAKGVCHYVCDNLPINLFETFGPYQL